MQTAVRNHSKFDVLTIMYSHTIPLFGHLSVPNFDIVIPAS